MEGEVREREGDTHVCIIYKQCKYDSVHGGASKEGGGIHERVKHIMYYVYISLKNICNTTIFN